MHVGIIAGKIYKKKHRLKKIPINSEIKYSTCEWRQHNAALQISSNISYND